MSDEPFCTCTSKLHARTSFRVRRLYQYCHVYHSIKLLSLKNFYRLLNCTNGYCMLLYHSSVINDPFSVLDLCELHGSSFPGGATRTRHDDTIPGKHLLLHARTARICRASHWGCCNLVLHPPENTNSLVDVLYQCGSRCFLQAPSPPWHCCYRSACKVHVSHLHVPCVWRRIEVRCYPPLP